MGRRAARPTSGPSSTTPGRSTCACGTRRCCSAPGAGSRCCEARDVLREAIGIRGGDERALYLLSQAERQAGDLDAAEKAARRLIAQNSDNPRGFAALAEALEERRRYQAVVDALAPAMPGFRSSTEASAAPVDAAAAPRLRLPAGRPASTKRSTAFEEARQAVTARSGGDWLSDSGAPRGQAVHDGGGSGARGPRRSPDDLRLARLEAQALKQSGRPDEGVAAARGSARPASPTIPRPTSRWRTDLRRHRPRRRRPSKCCKTRRRSSLTTRT